MQVLYIPRKHVGHLGYLCMSLSLGFFQCISWASVGYLELRTCLGECWLSGASGRSVGYLEHGDIGLALSYMHRRLTDVVVAVPRQVRGRGARGLGACAG